LADKDLVRRWTLAIAQLRSRVAKVRRITTPDALDVIDQSLMLSDAVVRELAGAGLQFDVYRTQLDAQEALWAHLFAEMPLACVETDASGIIFNANRAAATMLNTSVKHLGARLLLHFAEDRDQFGQVLRGLSSDGSRYQLRLNIRPRERALIHVEATVVQRSPGDTGAWLWFLAPADRPQPALRRRDKGPSPSSEAPSPMVS
jgi:PAS domain-containing protein